MSKYLKYAELAGKLINKMCYILLKEIPLLCKMKTMCESLILYEKDYENAKMTVYKYYLLC
jgi:hypothetical protein